MRFTVLYHVLPATADRPAHWDFLVEVGNALATWAIEQPPDQPGAQPAHKLPDHRPLYLDYEGPVSGGRGDVSQWDTGTCEIEQRSVEQLVYRLQGTMLRGRASLTLIDPANNVWEWEFLGNGT